MVNSCSATAPFWRMSWYSRCSRTTPLPCASMSMPVSAPGALPSSITRKRTGLPSFAGPSTRCRSRARKRNTMRPGAAASVACSRGTFQRPRGAHWLSAGVTGAA